MTDGATAVTEPTRTELKIAEALGLAQATRAIAEAVSELAVDGKVRRQVRDICDAWALWQERLNELVVEKSAGREVLLSRAAEIRDLHRRTAEDRIASGDELDGLEALAGLAAQDVAHWRIVREMAGAQGDKKAHKLAEQALPGSKRQLKATIKACGQQAKAVAKRLEKPEG
jgi:hypothetical protein